ncbi:transcription-repair coupling factor [Schlesneria paludicola]|uniref:transcription-repair coupling factor n=1 Tax=Schlesneria paludicola TaxID=360056 RepID=UPI000299F58A|nr:transcription-repair coupling factor [Schlesneria paludicola]
MAGIAENPISQLTDLPARLLAQPGMTDVVNLLQQGQEATIDGAWGSTTALAAVTLSEKAPGSLLVVLPHEKDVDGFKADVAAFGLSPQLFPSWAAIPKELSIIDPILASRLRVLRALESSTPPKLVITTIHALLQPVPSHSDRTVASRTMRLGEELNLEELIAWLIERGFERVTAIELPGEFCIHGGIVDIFSPDMSAPVRIELFGDEIESIRLFDVESQLKVSDLQEIDITIVSPISHDGSPDSDNATSTPLPADTAQTVLNASALESLPPSSWVVFVQLSEIVGEGKRYLDRLADPRGLLSVESTLERCARHAHVTIAPLLADTQQPTCHLQVESIERFGGAKSEALPELAKIVQQDEMVLIACHNEAARTRLAELLTEVFLGGERKGAPPEAQNPLRTAAKKAASTTNKNLVATDEPAAPPKKPAKKEIPLPPINPVASRPAMGASTGGGLKRFLRGPAKDAPKPDEQQPAEQQVGSSAEISNSTAASSTPIQAVSSDDPIKTHPFLSRIRLCIGHVAQGFRLRSEKLIVLSDNELFGRADVQRTPRRSKIESRAIDSFLDLNPGDLVVHLSHGIARFRGMEVQQKGEHTEDHLALEFGGGIKVYVPVSLIHLVQKYVGGGKASPELSKLGGTSWANKKKRVTEAVCDMASDMIKLQAERDMKPGLQCPPDSHWVQEFDAAFPYTETDDQLRAIGDLKKDMERPRPMDRLICGDVGYGKTEVAMRAAFKAVDAGRQVAILVPTTVLCEQHFRSLSERMAEFPVNIASLNRFKSAKEVRETLEGLATGTIDICIGTHRLVSKDVKFKDLGLLVIDEEQRFGVEVKELLKHLRLEVDVLTLSATPIPRTLHMSLVGVRDISNLETPPQDRQAVETRICRWDKELLRSAIVRELNRDGQIYFVHNRIYNIESIADDLRSLVPEATVDIVHGQMAEEPMEAAMMNFVQGRTNILVATTIIESGLDIPNANTIFINQANNYGLSDLHQLRGRVGRYKHRAYCYLLLDDGKTLSPQASRRLKAIEEFSELGAGFKIAMRDLEIRGAGNILGTEQSGHIASVGYELYCQLLENAVRAAKRQPLREHRHVEVNLPVTAYLPPDYIPEGRPKIEIYRKFSLVSTRELLEELKTELRDRFGPLPEPVEKMIQIRELQILAIRWQIDDIHLEPNYAVFGYRNPKKINKLARLSSVPVRVVDDREACLVLPPRLTDPEEILALLKTVLESELPTFADQSYHSD